MVGVIVSTTRARSWPVVFSEMRQQFPLKRLISFAVAGVIVSVTVSIAASYILLTVAIVLTILESAREGKIALKLPPYAWVLGLFLLACVLSALLSEDVPKGFGSL